MFEFDLTGAFKKDLKKIKKRNLDKSKLALVLDTLENTGTLPFNKYKTHILKGDYKGCLEAHIERDWLIIWRLKKNNNVVELVRTGSHTDVFKKF